MAHPDDPAAQGPLPCVPSDAAKNASVVLQRFDGA